MNKRRYVVVVQDTDNDRTKSGHIFDTKEQLEDAKVTMLKSVVAIEADYHIKVEANRITVYHDRYCEDIYAYIEWYEAID